MSRFKRFTHSVLTGYALMGINVLYTLASVPLALKYLSVPEFGLWALTSQIAAYLTMVDFGMGSSVARILIDLKDARSDGRYGGAIKTGLLVGAVQGTIVLTGGLVLSFFLGGWFQISAELTSSFFWLLTGQIVLAGISFVSRIFNQVLFASQRLDIQNYSQMVQLIVSLLMLWVGFALGWRVMSLLAGQVLGWMVATAFCGLACRRLGLWPKTGEWGAVSRQRFQELFRYGADVFLIAIGTQVIMSTQTVLVSGTLGMTEAALWSVMTKAFTLLTQGIWRIVGNSMPAFAEMIARQENDRLWDRYRILFITVNVSSGIVAVLFAACNRLFVQVWTQGQFTWSATNDLLLGAWIIVLTQQCCHNSIVITFKQVRGLKYVFFLEGMAFVCAATVVLPRFGMTGMLVCSLAGTVLFTGTIGVWRARDLLGTGLRELLWNWQMPLFRVLLVMVPCWIVTDWALQGAPVLVRLLVNGSVLVLVGILGAFQFALPRNLTLQLVEKLPQPLRRLTLVVTRWHVKDQCE